MSFERRGWKTPNSRRFNTIACPREDSWENLEHNALGIIWLGSHEANFEAPKFMTVSKPRNYLEASQSCIRRVSIGWAVVVTGRSISNPHGRWRIGWQRLRNQARTKMWGTPGISQPRITTQLHKTLYISPSRFDKFSIGFRAISYYTKRTDER